MPDKKVCSICKVEKNIEEFGIVTRSKDGRRNCCKACHNKRQRTPERNEKERLRAQKPEVKLKRKIRESIPKNKLRIKEYEYNYLRRPEVIERKKDNHERYKKDPEKRENSRKRRHEYRKTARYKELHIRYERKRKSRLKDDEYFTLTPEQWIKIVKLQGNRCTICGKKFTKKNPPTRDHIIPLIRTGPHTMENIQAVHHMCNSSKQCRIDKSNIVSWIDRPDLCCDSFINFDSGENFNKYHCISM